MGRSPHSVHFDAVKTAFTSTLLAALTWTQALAANVDEELAKFSQRFQAAQPSGLQQAIWKLDWEDQLTTALTRAKTERRPVLFIHVTNISGPSNFGTGHC